MIWATSIYFPAPTTTFAPFAPVNPFAPYSTDEPIDKTTRPSPILETLTPSESHQVKIDKEKLATCTALDRDFQLILRL